MNVDKDQLTRITTSALGEAGEHRIMSELLFRGHNPFKASLDRGIDVILETGLKVQVKTSWKSKKYNSWAFSFTQTTTVKGYQSRSKKSLEDIDFVILWAIGYDFFVIPAKELDTTHLTLSEGGKWDLFKDAWYLLDEESPLLSFCNDS